MAKSKNHTAHNQSYKAHRHGIKKVRNQKMSLLGRDQKLVKNLKYVKKHQKRALKIQLKKEKASK